MIRHLVLCGLGPGHMRLLAELFRQPAHQHADIGISLLTRQHRYISDAALLGMIASPLAASDPLATEHFARQASTEAERVETMVQKSGVRWISNSPQALDLANKALLLDDGRTLRFDWLSVEPEPVQNRDLIEQSVHGARANGLFVRPREAFFKLWPQVQALAATRSLRFAVVLNPRPDSFVGETLVSPFVAATAVTTQPLPLEASAPPVPTLMASALPPAPAARDADDWALEKHTLEIAFALRHAFKGCAVTLITGGAALGEGLPPALQDCIRAVLKKRQITVLRDAATAISPGEVALQSGARLACDVPLLMLGPITPDWLTGCGLALGEHRQVQTDRALRSASHPFVFINTQTTTAHARRLLQGLRRVIAGQLPPTTTALPATQASLAKNAVYRVNCADGNGIVSWRNWAIESRQF